MKSNTDLMQAYYGIFSSSKEIIKNNQRNLFVNMLDLLSRTTKTVAAESREYTDECRKFWLEKILPLILDSDNNIQSQALSAVEIALNCINMQSFHSHPDWPSVKGAIVDKYPQELTKILQALNSNWPRIWCILIRILDSEIVKEVAIINKFLSIVEAAFRHTDYRVRAEAFVCWKVLIEVFAKNKEISSPRRIKLICIPLKSSPAKSLQCAMNKLRTWWYFICQMGDGIEPHQQKILDPFLTSFFGSSDNTASNSTIRVYDKIKKVATICLASLLGPTTNEMQNYLESIDFEVPSGRLINEQIMQNSWKHVVNAAFEIISLYDEKDANLVECVWRNLSLHLPNLSSVELYRFCLSKLHQLAKNSHTLLPTVINTLGTRKLKKSTELPPTELSEIFSIFVEILSCFSGKIDEYIVDAVVANIFDMSECKDFAIFWNIFQLTYDQCLNKFGDDESDLYTTLIKIKVWTQLSRNIPTAGAARIPNSHQWIVWPFRAYINSKKHSECCCFNDEFCDVWKRLVHETSLIEGNHKFHEKVSSLLKDTIASSSNLQLPNFSQIVSIYIANTDHKFDDDSKPNETLEFVRYLLSRAPIDGNSNDEVVKSFEKFLLSLQENQITSIFEVVKSISSHVISAERSKFISRQVFEHFKRIVQDKFNKFSNKNQAKQIKSLFDTEDAFVIIPKVWSMKPDKLTEHQKEKMNERRADIPALYNDMSQSQDESLKPWTPKKIIIAKDNEDEIVLENSSKSDSDCSTISNNNDPTGKKRRKTFSKEDEELLKKFNVDTSDEKAGRMLKQLKSITIDMVEGKNLLQSGRRKKQRLSIVEKAISRKSSVESTSEVVSTSKDDDKKSSDDADVIDESPPRDGVSIDTPRRRRLSAAASPFSRAKADKSNVEPAQSNTKAVEKSSTDQDDGNRANIPEHPNSELYEASPSILRSPRKPPKSISGKGDESSTPNSPKRTVASLTNNSSPKKISEISPGKLGKGPIPREAKQDTVNGQECVKSPVKDVNSSPSRLRRRNSMLSEAKVTESNNSKSPSKKGDDLKSAPMDKATRSLFDTGDDQSNKTPQGTPGHKTRPSSSDSEMKELTSSDEGNIKSPTRTNTKPIPESPFSKPQLRAEKSLKSPFVMPKMSVENTPYNPPLKVSFKATAIPTTTQPESPANVYEFTGDGQPKQEAYKSVSPNQQIRVLPPSSSPERKTSPRKPSSPSLRSSTSSSRALQEVLGVIESPTPSSPPERKAVQTPQTALSSPERKTILNASSPVLRTKLASNMNSRGAQLINMIRNKKPRVLCPEVNSNAQVDHPTTPNQCLENIHVQVLKDSPMLASPTTSILKRKHRESIGDSVELPSNKRKRVSFHDPPVSATKEFIRPAFEHEGSARIDLKSRLPQDSASGTPSPLTKHSLRRKSRVASMLELSQLASAANAVDAEPSIATASPATATVYPTTPLPSIDPPMHTFKDDASLLDYVLDKYTPETLIEKYLNSKKFPPGKSARAVANTLLNFAKKDQKIKTETLEILAESYPSEFLECAIQENAFATVCERLNFDSLVEFICTKARADDETRQRILSAIHDTLTAPGPLTKDMKTYLILLLQNNTMTSDEILSFIEILATKQRSQPTIEHASTN